MGPKRGRPSKGDAALTGAERYKCHREKHLAECRESEALRKRHKREISKLNPVADAERRKQQAIAKRVQRQRRKNEALANIEQPNTAEQLASEPVLLTPPTQPFKHQSTKSRSLKRAESALPKSPRKRAEIVKELATSTLRLKFQLRVGRKRNELSEEQREWLLTFLDRPDISTQTPGRKDHVYVGKENGERKYLQKRYLIWTIRELLEIANGSQLTSDEEEEEASFQDSFGCKLTFRLLYDFLKNRKEYKWSRDTPHESCTCELCENVRMFIQAINRKLPLDKRLPTQQKQLVEDYSCDVTEKSCMSATCNACPQHVIAVEDFKTPVDEESEGESDSDSEGEENESEITYYMWGKADGKSRKLSVSVAADDIPDLLKQKIDELKYHLFVKNKQYSAYNNQKANLSANSIMMHVDYAESYENKQQDECQAAYFGHENFSMFTAVVYVRAEDGSLQTESFVVISEAPDHSRIAAHSCIQRVIDEVLKLYAHLQNFDTININIWSDGCSAQFRSSYIFRLTHEFARKFVVTRYYNEKHHGKGPMDGIGGCVKNKVFRAVLSRKLTISSPKEFAEAAGRLVKGIHSLYMPLCEVMKEPEDVANAEYHPNMKILSVHMVKRVVTRAGFSCVALYKIASDNEPFYQQWYGNGVDDPCGHFDLASDYDEQATCAECKKGETGEPWMQCPSCDYWFHDDCFSV